MIRTKAELKSYFETGDFPTEENFSDLIDTLVTETDIESIKDGLKDKVDKVEGKGLSTNDYTDEDKKRVAQGGKIAEADVRKLYEASLRSKYGPMNQIEDLPNSVGNGYGVYFTLINANGITTVATLSREAWSDITEYRLRVLELDGSGPIEIVNISLADVLCGQIATQEEIDAIFEDNSGGSSSSSSY